MKLLLILFLILFIVPVVYAAEYGSDKYGCGLYGEGCSDTPGGGSSNIPYLNEITVTPSPKTPLPETPAPKTPKPETPAPKTPPPEISINPMEIDLNLVVNANKEVIISISNPGKNKITIPISQKNLDDMVILRENSLDIEPGETEELSVIFVALNDAGVFAGKIIVGNKEILVSLEIKTKLLLFDSNIDVLNKDYVILQGDELRTQVTLIPKGDKEKLDVTLNYVIKDYDGNVYLTKSETLFVEGPIDFERNFETGSIPAGAYVIGLELVYPNGVAPSSAHFKVIEKEPLVSQSVPPIKEVPSQNWANARTLGGIIIVLTLFIFLIRRKKKS